MSEKNESSMFMLKIPADIKKQMAAHCKKLDTPMNGWIVSVIRSALYHRKGLPEPPQAFAPLPTPAEEIRAWAEGRKILTPCGKQGSCYGTLNPPKMHDGMGFCGECDIRVV